MAAQLKKPANEVVAFSGQKLVLPDLSFIGTVVEPIREALQVIQACFRRITEAVRVAVEQFVKPLSIAFTRNPMYLVQSLPSAIENPIEQYITIENDQYGFFVVDGKRLRILHPSSSRCGKLLYALLKRRAQIVDYESLKNEIGAGNLDKDFKDLKYQLSKQGYELDYERPRTCGIALKGVKTLQ